MVGKRSVTATDLARCGKVSVTTVATKFGSLRNANFAAGLVPRRDRVWSNADLLRFVRDVWDLTLRDHGRSPRMADLRKYRAPVNPYVIVNRFGSWKRALIAVSQLPDNEEIPETWNNLPRQRKWISPQTRLAVFQRDLYQCRICHASGVKLEMDHIVPHSKGGADTMDNLQALYVPCNRGKSNDLQ